MFQGAWRVIEPLETPSPPEVITKDNYIHQKYRNKFTFGKKFPKLENITIASTINLIKIMLGSRASSANKPQI